MREHSYTRTVLQYKIFVVPLQGASCCTGLCPCRAEGYLPIYIPCCTLQPTSHSLISPPSPTAKPPLPKRLGGVPARSGSWQWDLIHLDSYFLLPVVPAATAQYHSISVHTQSKYSPVQVSGILFSEEPYPWSYLTLLWHCVQFFFAPLCKLLYHSWRELLVEARIYLPSVLSRARTSVVPHVWHVRTE